MATTQQEIQDAYNRAKQKLDANKALALKQAAERLALQTQEFGQNKVAQQQAATQTASNAYVSAQQGQRVLGSQLAQGGLGQTGYKSLAQKRMSESLNKNRQSINTSLQGNLQSLQQGQNANLLSNQQNVANVQNDYSQNLADINLNKKESMNRLSEQGKAESDFNSVISAGMNGSYTYNQFKEMLENYDLTQTQKTAYLQGYLNNQNKRYAQELNIGQIQTNPATNQPIQQPVKPVTHKATSLQDVLNNQGQYSETQFIQLLNQFNVSATDKAKYLKQFKLNQGSM